jgi:hypothetical protein
MSPLASPWWRWALGALALAAATGALLRFGLFLGMPAWAANFGAVRHAHSHLMYFGWVTVALFGGIWAALPRLTGRPLPPGVRWQMGATVALALLSFPAFWSNGYALTEIGQARLPLGSMAATFCGFSWFWFVALYVRATWALPQRPPAVQLWDWGLFLLLVASAGAAGLVGLVVTRADNPFLQQFFLHQFLDLFGIGWFTLGLLGLLWAYLDLQGVARPARLPIFALALALTPTFLLGMSPAALPAGWVAPLTLANAAAGTLVGWHLLRLWQRRNFLPVAVQVALLFGAGYTFATWLMVWPGLWQWSAGTQLRIFFLHLVLLGWISSALWGLIGAAAPVGAGRRLGDLLWLGGVTVMIAALLGIGLVSVVPLSAILLLEVAAWASRAPAAAALLRVGEKGPGVWRDRGDMEARFRGTAV